MVKVALVGVVVFFIGDILTIDETLEVNPPVSNIIEICPFVRFSPQCMTGAMGAVVSYIAVIAGGKMFYDQWDI